MKRFWNWVRNTNTGQRELWMDGPIAEDTWYGDEVTPCIFKEELMSGKDPINIHLNSPGGDCVAASQIYTMLMDYPADVTVQIDGMAASAASVVAMAGTTVKMSPTSMLMIHNPWTSTTGDAEDMRKTIGLLGEVKESIINAYEIKTGLSRDKISAMMDSETWMNAKKAKEMGFCDEVLYENDQQEKPDYFFSAHAPMQTLMNRVKAAQPVSKPNDRVNADELEKRLMLLK